MPVLDIEIVLQPGENLHPELVRQLARRAGEIFASPPGNTWVKVHLLAKEQYAENSDPEQEDFFPVFVSVLKAKRPAPDAMLTEVARLTAAVAQIYGRPESNVHIIYLPDGAGRVAFGGNIVSA